MGRGDRLPLVRYPAVQEDEPLWRGKAGAANRNGAYGTAFWKKYRIILMNNKVIILNISFLIILSVCTIISCGKIPYQEDIYGVWKGEYQDKELLFTFKSDQTCELSFTDKESDSVEILNGNFEINFSKKPMPLSVRNIPQLNHPLYTIVEFIGSESIRLASFSPRWRLRPISFNHSTSINLERVKQKI